MKRTTPRVLILMIGAGILGCSGSTEAVDQAYVTIAAGSPVVLRGDQLELSARLWSRTSPGDSVEVRNAELVWSTDDPTLATLTPKDNNTAIATGVNSGLVQIRAVAAGYEGAAAASFSLRVSDPLEIDSMRPSVVRYGDKVTMYGVGVENLFFATLQGATLVPDTFSFSAGAGGVGQMSFWVPPPAVSGRAVVLSTTQIVTAPDSTFVVEEDLLEPNTTAPRLIDLTNGPFASLPDIRFYNPALAFEELGRDDTLGVDWYRLTGASAGSDLTVVFVAPNQSRSNLKFLASAVNTADSVAVPGWTIGSGLYYCKDHEFKVDQRSTDSLIVALKNVASDPLDLISLFTESGRYGVAVLNGYLTSDPAIGPDQFEENDNCEFADRNFANQALQVDVETALSTTLTIDNPHDVDWIRFRVSGPATQLVTLKTAPGAGLSGNTAGDIDLHVLAVPVPGSPTDIRGSSRRKGSSESLTLTLAPGEYYIVVTDFAGTPTRYALCAAIGTSCAFPPGSAAAAVNGAISPRAGALR